MRRRHAGPLPDLWQDLPGAVPIPGLVERGGRSFGHCRSCRGAAFPLDQHGQRAVEDALAALERMPAGCRK